MERHASTRGRNPAGPAIRLLFAACILIASLSVAFADGDLKFFDLGNLRLKSGDIIRDCRLAYRTFGELAPDKSNVVLFPTWLAATT